MPRRRSVLPRKLPKQDRGRETVNAILGATAHVLVRHGFEGASTNRIAARAGVSIGSLYQYYPSKEALVGAVQERHVAEMLGNMEHGFDRVLERPLRDAVREMVRTLIAAHAVDPALHRVLMEQVPRVAPKGRAAEFEQRFEALVLAYLEARQDQVRPRDLPLAAFIVVQVAEALTHAAVLDRPELLAEGAFIDEVTELLVRYITVDRSTPVVATKLEDHADQLGALGHPVRLSILRFVARAGPEGAPAGAIQAHVRLPASTLSHHLKRLVDTGIVQSRGAGTFHYYSTNHEALRTLRSLLRVF